MANTFLRPGTLFIVVLALVVGLGIYNWSAGIFPETGESTGSIGCSTLEVEFLGTGSNGTHSTAFIRVSRERSYAAIFHGSDGNFTRIVEDASPGSIREVSAPVSPLQDLSVKVNGCSRVFRP